HLRIEDRVGRIGRVPRRWIRSRCDNIASDEAAEIVLVIAVVDTPVLVLALEGGDGPDVLLADQQRVTSAVINSLESRLTSPRQQLGARATVVEVRGLGEGLAIPGPHGG